MLSDFRPQRDESLLLCAPGINMPVLPFGIKIVADILWAVGQG